MRCSVCGRKSTTHKTLWWALFKDGQEVQRMETNKCHAIRVWQDQFLFNGGSLKRVK